MSTVAADTSARTRSIPFGRPMIGPQERDAVMAVLSEHTLTHGPIVERFEAAFAGFTGAPHAVAVSSCTAALHLAYLDLGIGPGDEVIVPALTHVATAHAVEMCGARPVFVDVEPETGNLDVDLLEAALTERTRAVSVVHFLGLPADTTRIVEIASRRGLPVVEDCALAVGGMLEGVHVGLHGDVGCFSFYPVKHITTAEGGMLITRRDDLGRSAAARRAFGIDRNVVSRRPNPGEYDVLALGNNYRMSEISAALGLAQMKRLPGFLETREANHRALGAGLATIDEVETLRSTGGRFRSAYYCHCILPREPLLARRAELMSALKARGIGVSVYYPKPVPHLTFYRRKYGFADSCFPVASRLSASIALPVGPHLGREDMAFIVGALKDAIRAVT